MPITKDLHLPVVMLKMGDGAREALRLRQRGGLRRLRGPALGLPHVPPGHRPCRRPAAGEEPEPVHFLFEDDFCKGHAERRNGPSTSWNDDQRLHDQEELETGFRDIVSHPWFIGGQRQLDPKRMEMFYTACYDLDTFRRFVFDSTSFTERFELEEELLEQLKTDDEALLRFAFRWLRFALFAEPTMTVTDSAIKDATGATLERES